MAGGRRKWFAPAFLRRIVVMPTVNQSTFALLLGLASAQASAAHLCQAREETLFAFANQAGKLMSVCRGPQASYLVYRFGTPARIELQFPDKLDGSSWKQFEFEGRRRGGGKRNAGFFAYSLSFSTQGASYTVYQDENSEDDSYQIGIDIAVRGKQASIKGVVKGVIKTQQGSLIGLDDTRDKLPNGAEN